ncbi:U9-ctenitoxin-Pr1a-like [Stegodyphus dumicola]|uniref:U9-ctenitoxin-Pr1a-like n=1 Tax=Stegodyphus dumicola TaxID=202533 RepID=UPI0015A9DBCD|nr:U9-ctenitoxin-Pr1a-like [Stegodyphus dumicola]
MMLLANLIPFFFIGLALADDLRSCISDDNCREGECCVFMAFIRGFCHTLGKEGDHCIMTPAETEHGKKNIFGCPCQEGLECVPGEVVKENGKTIYRNLTCNAATF